MISRLIWTMTAIMFLVAVAFWSYNINYWFAHGYWPIQADDQPYIRISDGTEYSRDEYRERIELALEEYGWNDVCGYAQVIAHRYRVLGLRMAKYDQRMLEVITEVCVDASASAEPFDLEAIWLGRS